MENASVAFLDAEPKSMTAIRTAAGAATIYPYRLTRAERLQYEGCLRLRPRGGGAQARRHPTSDVARRDRLPLRQGAGGDPACRGMIETRLLDRIRMRQARLHPRG